MKKTLIALLAAGTMLSGAAANAAIWKLDNPTLSEIQVEYTAGNKFQYYPGVVRENSFGARVTPTSGYIFKDELKVGTVLPSIVDVNSLLIASKKEQKVLVASVGDTHSVCFPVFAELAYQNQVSCGFLMDHILENLTDDSKLHKLGNAVTLVQDKIQEIADKAAQEASDEVSKEVENWSEDIKDEIEDEVSSEVAAFAAEQVAEQGALAIENLSENLEEALGAGTLEEVTAAIEESADFQQIVQDEIASVSELAEQVLAGFDGVISSSDVESVLEQVNIISDDAYELGSYVNAGGNGVSGYSIVRK